MKTFERITTYGESCCWQHHVQRENRENDLRECPFNPATATLKEDYVFQFVPRTDKPQCSEVKYFIEKHEWMGTVGHRPTHRFRRSASEIWDACGGLSDVSPQCIHESSRRRHERPDSTYQPRRKNQLGTKEYWIMVDFQGYQLDGQARKVLCLYCLRRSARRRTRDHLPITWVLLSRTARRHSENVL